MVGVVRLVLVVLGVAGEPEPTAVEGVAWVAPPGCPTAVDIGERLGDGPRLPLRAEVTTDEQGAAVRIEVDTTEGVVVRELNLDSCAAAAEAVVLVHDLAVAADAPQGAPTAEPPTQDEPVQAEKPGLAEDSAPKQESGHAEKADNSEDPGATDSATRLGLGRQRDPMSLALVGDAAFAVASLPRQGALVRLGLRLDTRWLLLSVRAEHAFNRRVRRGDFGVDLSATLGGLTVSTRLAHGRFELHPRVGVLGGALRARGRGGVDPETRWLPWFVADAAVGAVWMVSPRFGLRGSAELRLPLVRHGLTFDTVGVAQTARAGGLVSAGVEVRFDLEASP